MKSSYIFLILLLLNQFEIFSQIDVFSCSYNQSVISQSEFTNSQNEIFKNCIYFDNNNPYTPNENVNKSFKAHDEIHIKSDFHDFAIGNNSHDYSTSNKADFDVFVTNYSDLQSILRYEKLEIGITLPNSIQERVDYFINESTDNYNPINNDLNLKLNPFLEWEIKVETTFTHYDGFEKKIYGFYYQDFERDYENKKWNKLESPYPFLTRFAPPLNGNWKAITKITVGNNAEVYISDPYFFTVIESGNPGFVKVHENNRNLKLGDRMIFPVGHNLGWAGILNEWHSSELSTWNDFDHWKKYSEEIQTYESEGSRFARMHLHNGIMDIEWEHVGNYKDRMQYAWEIDKLFEFFEEKNMLIDFTLMMQTQLMQIDETHPGLDFDGDYIATGWSSSNPSGYWSELGLRTVTEYISNTSSIKYLKQRLRYLISRYCYSTSIYLIDIHSEINLTFAKENHYYSNQTDNTTFLYSNYYTRVNIFNYHKTMSSYIKNELNHKEHLLSVNYSEAPTSSNPNAGINFPDETYFLEEIDVVSFNSYSHIPQKFFISNENASPLNLLSLRLTFGKPIIVAEVGSGLESCWNEKKQTNISDLMLYGFMGIAGFNTWFGLIDHPETYPPVRRASDHMNGDDVIETLSNGGGNWSIGMEKNISNSIDDNMFQHFYYKSNDKSKVVGVIKNNSYNHLSIGGGNCNNESAYFLGVDPKYFTIVPGTYLNYPFSVYSLLANHNYQINYYSFYDYLASQCSNTSVINGHLGLAYPPLIYISSPVTPYIPILWYVAKAENCMNGMVIQSESAVKQKYIENKNLIIVESDKLVNVFSDNINQVAIYPNPANEYFIIDTKINEFNVKIIDLKGIEFICKKSVKNEKIDINELNAGYYILVFESKNYICKLPLLIN